jgi:Rrf2 family protein
MQMKNGVEAVLHCCALLALLPAGRALPAGKLAEYHGLPAAYLAKQMQELAVADIVAAGRGRVTGGYRLARAPERITLLDIVEAVEGSEPMFRCAGIRFRGPCAGDPSAYPATCAVTAAMRTAEDAWRNALANQTLADLVTATVEQAVPEVAAKAMVWLNRSAR